MTWADQRFRPIRHIVQDRESDPLATTAIGTASVEAEANPARSRQAEPSLHIWKGEDPARQRGCRCVRQLHVGGEKGNFFEVLGLQRLGGCQVCRVVRTEVATQLPDSFDAWLRQIFSDERPPECAPLDRGGET